MTTRKGEATRQKIVAAAWDAVEDLGVEQLLAGVTLREVARRADMSPSMVTYHFGSSAELAEAMAAKLLDDVQFMPADVVVSFLQPDRRPLGEVLRSAADLSWRVLTMPEVQLFSRRLMRLYAAFGIDGEDDHLAKQVQAQYWDAYLAQLEQIYRAALDHFDLRLVEPFDPALLARVGAAFESALLQQWMISPDEVPAGLTGDVLLAVITSITRSGKSRVELAELEAELEASLDSIRPAFPAAGTDIGSEITWLQQTAAAAAPLFTRGWKHVSMTDVSDHVDVPVKDLVASFGTVRRVAAVSFARHVDRLSEAMRRRIDAGPEVSAADYFCELARCVQADRPATSALIAERMWAAVGSDDFGPGDIRYQVPIGAPARAAVSRLGVFGRAQLVDLTALMVDTVLSYASTRPDAAPAAVAEIVMRLVPRD